MRYPEYDGARAMDAENTCAFQVPTLTLNFCESHSVEIGHRVMLQPPMEAAMRVCPRRSFCPWRSNRPMHEDSAQMKLEVAYGKSKRARKHK